MPEKRSVTALAATFVIAFAIGVGIAVIAHNNRLPPIYNWFWPRDGSDDQPPIIVSNGSIVFEGGDSESPNPKKGVATWTQVDSKQHWKADHAGGFDVNGFTVYVAGNIDPQKCQQTTMRADDVEIDYTTGSSQQMVFHVKHEGDKTSSHPEPHVHANDATVLSLAPGNPTYPQLLADVNTDGTATGKGWITRVASVDGGGNPFISCPLLQPRSDQDRKLVRITIVPER